MIQYSLLFERSKRARPVGRARTSLSKYLKLLNWEGLELTQVNSRHIFRQTYGWARESRANRARGCKGWPIRRDDFKFDRQWSW